MGFLASWSGRPRAFNYLVGLYSTVLYSTPGSAVYLGNRPPAVHVSSAGLYPSLKQGRRSATLDGNDRFV